MNKKLVVLPVFGGESNVVFLDISVGNIKKPTNGKNVKVNLIYKVEKLQNLNTPDLERFYLVNQYVVFAESAEKHGSFHVETGFELNKNPNELTEDDIERLIKIHQDYCLKIVNGKEILFPNGDSVSINLAPPTNTSAIAKLFYGKLSKL